MCNIKKYTKLLHKTCLAIALAILSSGTLAAETAVVDFENSNFIEGQPLTTEIPGLVFSNTIISKEGPPRTAFQGKNGVGLNDRTRDDENFGGFFITDPLVEGKPNVPGTIEIKFDRPVYNLGFIVADIDDFQYSRPDTFTGRVYDNQNSLLEEISITVRDDNYRTGDGIATQVNFSAINIKYVELNLVSTRNTSGWGIDNMFYSYDLMVDINGDNLIDLADAIIALKVLCGIAPQTDNPLKMEDINGNGMMGLEEIICILQIVSGIDR